MNEVDTAVVNRDQRLDNVMSVETAVGVELDLVPAGMVVRILANILDLGILVIVTGTASTAITALQLGATGMGLSFLVIFAVTNFYFVFFDVYNNGRSPGKSVFDLRVIHDDGTPIRLPASIIRNLLRWVEFLPVAFLSALVSMALSNGARRIGDHAAGTLVIYERSYKERSVREGGTVFESPVVLTPTEKTVFVEFLERIDRIGETRATELAESLYPITKRRGADALSTVRGIAEGIRGGS